MTTRTSTASARRTAAAAWVAAAMLTAACTSTSSHAGPPQASPTPASTAPTPAPVSTAPASTTPASSTAGAPAACLASQLAGGWTGVAGSAGMGQVSADLALKNTSAEACTIDGYPAFTLYSATGVPLPTHVSFDPIPVQLVRLQPGDWVHSELRYSPNVPGDGEPASGLCEPKASYALVTITGSSGTVRAALDTPQPICGKGRVKAKSYVPGPSSPVGG